MTTTTTTTTTAMTDRTVTSAHFESTKTVIAAPEKVLEALSTTEGVDGWWGTTIGSPTQGARFTVGFGGERRIDLVAVSVQPERVEWKVEDAPHTPEWAGTTIVFDIAPADGCAALRFRHLGLTPQLECFDMCEAGWTHFLASLFAFVETGVGHPYRP